MVKVKAKTIRVAAVQVTSNEEDIRRNLAHAEPFLMEAKSKGAQLILLPEFLPTGYCLEKSIWGMAEPSNGITVNWLIEQARKHSTWIGTSFLEADGQHFYNTFVLVDPGGNEKIRVRKCRPAATEMYFFKGEQTDRVADTEFGRIGVSICYEGALSQTIRELYEQKADLVIMPMSAPTPTLNKPLSSKDIEEYNTTLKSFASYVSTELGVPAVMANKVGPWKTKSPWPFPLEESSFPGFSTICDADGAVRSQLGNEEGVIVAEIELNARSKLGDLPTFFGKWARKPPKIFKLLVIAESLGRIGYTISFLRRRMAGRISARG